MKMDLPPITPNYDRKLEELLDVESLSVLNDKTDFEIIEPMSDLSSLYYTELGPITTTLRAVRDPVSGICVGYEEVLVDALDLSNKNSTSFKRAPGRITDDIRGNRANSYPFWPGGFEPPNIRTLEVQKDLDLVNDLLNTAPGMTRGMDFSKVGRREEKIDVPDDSSDEEDWREIVEGTKVAIDLSSLVENSREMQPKLEDKEIVDTSELDKALSTAVLKMPPMLKISNAKPVIIRGKEYARLLDVTKPVDDFYKRIPNMAKSWPFELDTFQKQAILKLEEGKHVFVAAHTSAGKTVVAEYAIALSQKHCSKAIYTSPIKALSNQKFREFVSWVQKRDGTPDVGLITGDLQINDKASCLIMTTEILRSMLFGGSDVIRDLEYVIFDEVHYINNLERGHVWEQILIMLPNTVRIVMLSATVPNFMDFANWVGMTKKAIVYVVSTPHRPVPLQHYIYVPSQLYLVREAEGPFLSKGYNEALVKSEILSKKNKNLFVKKDKTYWNGFLNYLKREDKLPAVVFILSRNKCDAIAAMLSGDLTNKTEKHHIQCFFDKSIKRLKEEDANLPQIKRMRELLLRGIGVHHSGILPILKEIIELLFQETRVKFLCATETFAMGVNMPTKTVAFDSIMKFADNERRLLRPDEYVQMAGRAGRRKLNEEGQQMDKFGTVIITTIPMLPNARNVSMDVPSKDDLKAIMFGQSSELISKFRLTYAMILSILRVGVKTLSVEDIMLRSFKEFGVRVQMEKKKKELSELEVLQKRDEEENARNSCPHFQKLDLFHQYVIKFLQEWQRELLKWCEGKSANKYVNLGCVIVVSRGRHLNKLALILEKSQTKNNSRRYKVLTLDKENEPPEDLEEEYYAGKSVLEREIFLPDKMECHVVLEVGLEHFVAVTKIFWKGEYATILMDCSKRQMPRFKNAAVGEECLKACRELYDKSLTYRRLDDVPCEIMRKEVMEDFIGIQDDIPCFDELYKKNFDFFQRKAKIETLKHEISPESTASFKDYTKKLAVLKKLQYINHDNIRDKKNPILVTVKGKVACEMNVNELILTELIFSGNLSEFSPEEIAALLSSFVLKGRVESVPSKFHAFPHLEEGVEMITSIKNDIVRVEELCQVNSEDSESELNFGLVAGVYEWACGKSFCEVMDFLIECQTDKESSDCANKTDIQEGTIVRCIQQLNELLIDIKCAVHSFGDSSLKKKMEQASECIKRDIVFTQSLYTQKDFF